MALKINGKTIENLKFNGKEIQKAIFNGKTIYTKKITKSYVLGQPVSYENSSTGSLSFYDMDWYNASKFSGTLTLSKSLGSTEMVEFSDVSFPYTYDDGIIRLTITKGTGPFGEDPAVCINYTGQAVMTGMITAYATATNITIIL